MLFKKRSILITGGAKRVGKKLVEHFVSAGHAVIFTYKESLKEAQELADSYDGVTAMRLDLTDEMSIYNFWNKLPYQVDVLINNASCFIPDSLCTLWDAKIFNKQISVNVAAPILMVQHFLKQKQCDNNGLDKIVVNFLDKWACDMPNNFLSYSLSKMSLRDFTMHLHTNYLDIKVFGILIGFLMYNPRYLQDFFDKNKDLYPSDMSDLYAALDAIIYDEKSDNIENCMIDLTKR